MEYKKYLICVFCDFLIVCFILLFVLTSYEDYHNYCYLDINGNLGYSNRCKINQCDKVDYVVNVDKYIIIDKH